jgi:hypothetical protein
MIISIYIQDVQLVRFEKKVAPLRSTEIRACARRVAHCTLREYSAAQKTSAGSD